MDPGGIPVTSQWNLVELKRPSNGTWWDPSDQLIEPFGIQVNGMMEQ